MIKYWEKLEDSWKYLQNGDPTFEGLSIAATLQFPVPCGGILLLSRDLSEDCVKKATRELIHYIEQREERKVGEYNKQGIPLMLSIRFGNKHIDDRKPKSISYLGANEDKYLAELKQCLTIFSTYCDLQLYEDVYELAQEIVYKAFLFLSEINVDKPYILIQRTAVSLFNERSGHGTAYSRNPKTGFEEDYGRYLLAYSGRAFDNEMQGSQKKKDLSELQNELPDAYWTLKTLFSYTEVYYRDTRFFEFIIEDGNVQIVQITPRKRAELPYKKYVGKLLHSCNCEKEIESIIHQEAIVACGSLNLDGLRISLATNKVESVKKTIKMFQDYDSSENVLSEWECIMVETNLPKWDICAGEPIDIIRSDKGIHLIGLKYRETKGEIIWIPRESVVIYLKQKEKMIFVIGQDKTNHGITDMLLEIIFNLWQEFLEHQGWVMVHASGVVIGKKVLLLIGEKGAGKTTMQLSFLTNGYPAFSLDRTFVRTNENNLLAHSWPSKARLNIDTLGWFPNLKEWFKKNDTKKSSKIQVEYTTFRERVDFVFGNLEILGIIYLNRKNKLVCNELFVPMDIEKCHKCIIDNILNAETDNRKRWLNAFTPSNCIDVKIPDNTLGIEVLRYAHPTDEFEEIIKYCNAPSNECS